MKISCSVLFLLFFSIIVAQKTESITFESKKGLFVGLGIGSGSLTLNTNDTLSFSFTTSLPNIKIGYQFNDKFALLALLPGANYKYNGKDRGFESIMLSGQYWIKEKWWVLVGLGLTFDAPAFYTVKDPKTAGFYSGFPSVSIATGYEIFRKKKFSIDLQYRFFLGKSNIQNNGTRSGFSNLLLVGFNWN